MAMLSVTIPQSRLRLRLVAVLAGTLALVAACGGGDPAGTLFSRSDDSIRDLVPAASSMDLRSVSAGDAAPEVDFVIATALEGEPRMHVISDDDAIAGGEEVDEYEGFAIFRNQDTFWAELEPTRLYAGTPDEEGLKAYLDFYRTGEPEFDDERFRNGYDYARGRITEELEETPSLLVVAYDGEWNEEAAGMRVEATLGERKLSVAILYAREGGSGELTLDAETLETFALQFALPEDAAEEPENPDWDYAHRLWYSDTGE